MKNKVDGVQKDVNELQDKVDELLKKLDAQEKKKSRVVVYSEVGSRGGTVQASSRVGWLDGPGLLERPRAGYRCLVDS